MLHCTLQQLIICCVEHLNFLKNLNNYLNTYFTLFFRIIFFTVIKLQKIVFLQNTVVLSFLTEKMTIAYKIVSVLYMYIHIKLLMYYIACIVYINHLRNTLQRLHFQILISRSLLKGLLEEHLANTQRYFIYLQDNSSSVLTLLNNF